MSSSRNPPADYQYHQYQYGAGNPHQQPQQQQSTGGGARRSGGGKSSGGGYQQQGTQMQPMPAYASNRGSAQLQPQQSIPAYGSGRDGAPPQQRVASFPSYGQQQQQQQPGSQQQFAPATGVVVVSNSSNGNYNYNSSPSSPYGSPTTVGGDDNDQHRSKGGAGFFTQMYATMRRQLLQKRRMWCGCLLEVFLPALFMLGLLLIAAVSGETDYGPQSFAQDGPAVSFGNLVVTDLLCRTSSAHADFGSLLSVCTGTAGTDYTVVPTSTEVPIAGLAIKGTRATVLAFANRFIDFQEVVEIPNFDQYVLYKWAASFALPTADNLFMERIGHARQPGKVFISPDTGIGPAFSTYMDTTFVLYKHAFGGLYKDREAAMPDIVSIQNEGKSWALYDLRNVVATDLHYLLSMNISATAMMRLGTRDRFAVGLGENEYASYLVSGALTLQKAISDYHAVTFGTVTLPAPTTAAQSKLALTPMPLDSYTDSSFLKIAGTMAPFLLVLSYLYSVSQLAKRLVEEKEQRLREGTMIMGLGKAAFFCSWLFIYYFQMIITSLIMAVIMKLGITTQTDFFIIWVTFLFFGFTTVNMSALLSTFFSKSKIAALCVPLLYFIFAIPAFAMPETTSSSAFHGLSWLAPMPFSISLQLIYAHEMKRGLGWNGVGDKQDTPYNYGWCLGWYIIDFVIYSFALVYFDNVLPKDWGTRLHPFYCCCCCCSGKSRDQMAADGAYHDSQTIDNARNHMKECPEMCVIQDYPAVNGQSSIHIANLRKEFDGANGKKNVAVNGMELRMFPDSITVLLGHNGAGKTTVMNMMTGMMSPTSGDITIYGNSILTDMQAIRRDIGFCPQHNILWDDLTCLEHLQYFARLKGFSGDEIDEEALELLQKVDLLDKKDVFSKNLSGGQKRKLSVAIAFMGRAKLVLLDEPTAGMDVAARRHTWDVLKDMAKGRTILLTTHYMDEADLLGNRIAVMSKGSLYSYGTPMFLKSNLGAGYVMRIACGATIADPQWILREVQSILPAAYVREAKGQELAIGLPKDATRMYPNAIRHMDSQQVKARFNISSVSVSVSTLEDVFLTIAQQEEMHGKTQEELAEEEAQHQQAFDALERVYLKIQKSQREANAGGARYGNEEMGNHNLHKDLTVGNVGGFGRQFCGMLKKRINHGRRDYCALCLQLIAPLICILVAMALAEIKAPEPKIFYWDNKGLYGNAPMVLATNNCPNLDPHFDTDFVKYQRRTDPSTFSFSNWLLSSFNDQGDDERFISISCADSNGDDVLFANATALASAPQAANQLYRARLRDALDNNAATIRAGQYPFPFSERQETQIDAIRAVLMALFILIPFTFVPSTYVAFVVRERQCKSKHLQFVSGASYAAYWLGNFVFDFISYLITVLIAFIIFAAFSQEWVIGSGEKAIGAIFLFVLYGISSIGFAYLISYLFDNHSSAQTVVMMVNFLIGFLLVMLMYFLRNIESTEDAAEVIVYFFLIAPPFALGDGLFAMVMANTMESIEGKKSTFSTEVAGYNMLFMGIFAVVFMALTLYIDHPSRSRKQEMLGFNSNAAAPAVAGEDADVCRERREVEGNARPTDVVQVRGLRKVFDLGSGKKKVAVQNVTFGVKPGEVFGFLGTNGAGKTTTMSMLTTEVVPSAGVATIGGYNVVDDAAMTRRLIGYCPQFDAIMDLLTPAEHLRLFSSLRGIDVLETEEVIDALIDSCGLRKYRDIPAGSLSGGNKRKLSVAMSLIGGPSIVFLDEPSAGMDPHARRMLWDVIIFVAKHSSVVLTTHHLEEVDVLAHRVGIMDQGLMKCLGSLEHLKMKFGNGFELTLQVHEGSQSVATEKIMSLYPTATLIEARQQRILFTLPFDCTDLATLFDTIQRLADDGRIGIMDYTLQQTSLEQVFLRIAQLGEEEEARRVANGGVDPNAPFEEVPAGRQNSASAYAGAVFNRNPQQQPQQQGGHQYQQQVYQ